MKPDNEKLIKQLVDNTRTLLEENWVRAEQVFGAGNIKLSIAHLVDFEHGDVIAKSTITFGARVKEVVEVTVRDNGEELPMEIEEKPKTRRDPRTVS